MKRTLAAALLTGMAVTPAGMLDAHTIASGYTSAGSGSLTIWYGTYHTTSFNEGSLHLTGTLGYDETVSFTLLTSTRPDGLIDGTNVVYSSGWNANSVITWQGVTFLNLTADSYTFTYVPIANPSADWAPMTDLASTTISVTNEDLGIEPTTPVIDTAADETSASLQQATLTFKGGRFTPNTAFTDGRDVSVEAEGGTIDTQNGTVLLSGTITGQGDLIKDGAGELDLTGQGTFSGRFLAMQGRLALNGQYSAATAEAFSGGSVGGNGVIGGLVVHDGGYAAPGNSIGHLSVAGNVTFEPGSAYEVELDSAGNADLLSATGTISIQGGTLRFLAAEGTYRLATTYVILAANGGVTGAFDTATSSLAFLTPYVTYEPNFVLATMVRNDVSFRSLGETPNQKAVGAVVETLGYGNPVYDTVIGQDTDAVPSVFNALSGEIFAATRTAALENSHFIRDALIDRARLGGPMAGDRVALVPDTRLTVWTREFGSWGKAKGDDRTATADRRTAGAFLGVETPIATKSLGTWTVGLGGGYSVGDLDLDSLRSDADEDAYHLGVYAGSRFGRLGIRLGAAYSWTSMDTTRKAEIDGESERLKAHPDSRTGQVFGEAGYAANLGPVALEPFAGLAYVNLDSDSIKESGGAAALRGKGDSADLVFSTLGLRAGHAVTVDSLTVRTRGMLGWRHAYGDTSPEAHLAFAQGSAGFAVQGSPVARDSLVVGAGAAVDLLPKLALGLDYNGNLAHDAQDHGLMATLTVSF